MAAPPPTELQMQTPAARPLALLAFSDEWLSRSFESIFEQHGYEVTRVKSGARMIKLARHVKPDAVVLEEGLGDLDALRVCAALGDDPLFDHSVPIVITSSAHVTPASRHAAYAAGAWEYCSHPVDIEALMLKLATFRRARAETVARAAERLVDQESGLYTALGVERLADHLVARAERTHEPIACVALALKSGDREVPSGPVAIEDASEDFAAVAELCRSASRKSDIVGHATGSRLTIVAPATDAAGARRLVMRLRRALEREDRSAAGPLDLRAGFCAVADLADSRLEPNELVRRAGSALDHLQAANSADVLLSFDEIREP